MKNNFWWRFMQSLAIAEKNIRIYYSKGPVIIFGLLMPLFLFLSFYIGRSTPIEALIPGLLGMTAFFTATSVGPAIIPWEARAKTLERLISSPISLRTILLGDVLSSFVFGILVSAFIHFLLRVLQHSALRLSTHRQPGYHNDAFLHDQVPHGFHKWCIHPTRRTAHLGKNHCCHIAANLFHGPIKIFHRGNELLSDSSGHFGVNCVHSSLSNSSHKNP
jgi:hypothetical protein